MYRALTRYMFLWLRWRVTTRRSPSQTQDSARNTCHARSHMHPSTDVLECVSPHVNKTYDSIFTPNRQVFACRTCSHTPNCTAMRRQSARRHLWRIRDLCKDGSLTHIRNGCGQKVFRDYAASRCAEKTQVCVPAHTVFRISRHGECK